MTYFAQNLRDGEPVALNFACMDADQSQRAIDWLAGACLAIGGKSVKIDADLFLFSPPTTTITTEPIAAAKAELAAGLLALSNVVAEDESD